MAADNRLLCSTSATDAEIANLFRKTLNTNVVHADGIITFSAPGLTGAVTQLPLSARDLFERQLGISPTKDFFFRLDKFETFDTGLETMIRFCIEIIRGLANDCVFMSEDQPLMLRRDRDFVLESSESDPWKKLLQRMAEGVGGQFTFGVLPPM